MKKFWVYLYDLVAAFLAITLALSIRLNEFSPEAIKNILSTFYVLICVSVITKQIAFYLFKVSHNLWRFTSAPDLKAIMKATVVAEFIAVTTIFLVTRGIEVPRTAFILDAMLTIYLIGGARIFYRFLYERTKHVAGKNTLVIGAGSAAERFLRDYQKGVYNFAVVGLLDDQASKIGRTLFGYRVLGSLDQIGNMIKKHEVKKVIIAITALSSSQIRKIVSSIADPSIEIVTIPSLKDVIEGKVTQGHLRPIDVNDLLGRDPVVLDTPVLAPMLKNKTVVVTGAGGSIGSELVRQLAKLAPKKIVLLDNNEFFLYELENEIKNNFPELNYHLVVGDVRDRLRLEQVFAEYRPEFCYHAAAYKHVPMMELNPHEAIKTNVLGTRNVLEVCKNFGVKKFIMISTDKAVRPSSVMGATKKIAEMLCQAYAQIQNNVEIVVVRFGNVLASHGSVVPLFMEQIKQGGPVTVTHHEMTRYFMSIPEASQLVLNASAIGRSGMIMVLDMGEPVKIMDLAKQLIQLSGFEPGVDIEIKEIGLRPGEKLYEELFYDAEKMTDTSYAKIKISNYHGISPSYLEELKLFEEKFLQLPASELRKALAIIISSEVEDIQKFLQ